VPAFVAAQLAGTVVASAALNGLFANILTSFGARGLVRGERGSQLSALVFGEYFPNPVAFDTTEALRAGHASSGDGGKDRGHGTAGAVHL